MADEFKTLMEGFTALGGNYCANARKVITDLESRKIIDIYETGLSGAMSGLGETVGVQYDALSDESKKAVDGFIRLSGALPMVEAANKTIGANSLQSVAAVTGAVELFPKIKKIIRQVLDIEKGGTVDKLLDWIDTIIENIPKLLGLVKR
ncbi:hypothetical protein [Desulfonema ishimotonii]|uniref:hypothetical protein n=1 Tax=Desulfonema ishimotonii TaxID=45657 RepID=UPI000F58E4CA|nr:hypothetical protein [Desulfonema ishimotonii]